MKTSAQVYEKRVGTGEEISLSAKNRASNASRKKLRPKKKGHLAGREGFRESEERHKTVISSQGGSSFLLKGVIAYHESWVVA